MKLVRVTLLASVLILSVLSTASAQNWQKVYQTDFSTDPGWETNNPNHYYWDQPTESYFTNNYTNSGAISGDWATTDITYAGESFRLIFDVKPARTGGDNGDVCVGLFGPNRESHSGTEERVFIIIGGYYNEIYLEGHSSCGETIQSPESIAYGTMENNQWHHVEIVYDATTMTISAVATRNGTTVFSWSMAMTCGFSNTLTKLGVSMKGSWSTAGRHQPAYIDNVTFSLQTPGEGANILVYITWDASCSYPCCCYPTSVFDEGLAQALGIDGHTVTVTDRVVTPVITPALLGGYDQIWFLSTAETHNVVLAAAEINAVLDFRNQGGGLFIAADHAPHYTWTANQIASPLGVQFYGSVDHAPEFTCQSPTFDSHPIFTGVSELLLGRNEGDIAVTSPADVVATYNGHNVVAVLDDGAGRCVFDGSIVRAFDGGVILCDNATYFRNIANWLQGGDGTVPVALDIKPGSCPNPLNVKQFSGKGGGNDDKFGNGTGGNNCDLDRPKPRAVLPAAIMGTDQFDVADIDIETIMLEGVPVMRWNYEDVGIPVGEDAEVCDCNTDGPDGYVDLTLKFDKATIVAALGEVEDGQVVSLTLEGQLMDGTPIEGSDCVVILGGKEPPVVDDATKGEVLPMEFALHQNHPNPFNPTTSISFALSQACNVQIDVLNVLGQRVVVLASGQFEAGEHSVEWDASAQASGVYFYRLTAGDMIETKKMVLLK